MGRKLTLTFVVGVTLAIGGAAIAIANGRPYVSTCLRSTAYQTSDCPGYPNLVAKFGGQVVPKSLPKHEMAPVALRLWGQFSTDDGTHPSALREATIDIDRNVTINAKGLPVCHLPGIQIQAAPGFRKRCREAVIGGAKADFELAFPESMPVRVPSKLAVCNGGVKDGVTTLYVRGEITVPVPAAIVVAIKIKKSHEGRYGLRAVATIPQIVGGDGSLLDLSLKVKRLFNYKGTRKSYAMARCPDGHLDVGVSTLFKNETRAPGVAPSTVIAGGLAILCTPNG